LLAAFDGRLQLHAQTYGDYRRKKLLGTVTRISERQDTPLTDAITDRSAAESIVAWINRSWNNEETNLDYRIALRVFGKRLAKTPEFARLETDSHGVPASVAWVSTGYSNEYDPSPGPREILE